MIVVAGEALIDLVPAGAVDGDALPALQPQLGGGPYNTAVALGRLGSPVTFCSRISRDAFGEALLGGLRSGGVDTSLVQRGEEPTTLAVAHIGADGSAGYGFYVDGTADRLFAPGTPLPEAVRAISFGTCSLVLEPGASAYEQLMRNAAERGIFTALDPNIRAELISDPDVYRRRFRSWLPYVSLLKLSEEDAEWLAEPGDLRPAFDDWLAAGPSAVVLTRGAAGLTVLTREGAELSVPGRKVTVADTIGAGDTVNAALLHRLDTHGAFARQTHLGTGDWHDTLDFAARAAALNCAHPGARPPYPAEIDALPAAPHR